MFHCIMYYLNDIETDEFYVFLFKQNTFARFDQVILIHDVKKFNYS